jgi:hypothetical protein
MRYDDIATNPEIASEGERAVSLHERIGHETQAFISETPPREAAFDQPTNDPGFRNKPSGGLWTSTLREDGMSAWLDWCETEQWGITDEAVVYALDPEPDVSVLVLDSQVDLLQLLATFARDQGHDLPKPRLTAQIDFEAVAKHYDAIHLTERGQISTRLATPGLYGWDTESSLWLHWAFRDVAEIAPARDILERERPEDES